MVLVVLLPQAAAAAASTSQATSQTVVSLTFDDGLATQYAARSALAAHGMHGTFYVNSGRLGTDDSYYMTWSQVHGLADDGNEIGGHTSHHVNMPLTDPTETQRQVCADRNNLLAAGFQVTDFAYPYGAFNAASESYVQGCGYNSARTTSQVAAPPSESIPPPDPYAIRIAGSGNTATSLATLKGYVTQVEEAGGGWVPLVFHQICDACDPNSITMSDFVALLDWLTARSANGTVVQTVREVVGGQVQPAVPGPAAPAPPNGTNALRNASLEQDGDGDHEPDCWTFDSYGSASYSWTRTTDAHSGSWGERVDVTNYVSGDSKLTPTPDLGYCTPSVTPGRTYRLTAWYKSNRQVAFTAFTRNGVGAFSFWDTSPSFPASSSSWASASWVTPPIPSGTTGLTFGLTLPTNGFLTVDDLGFDDAAATGGGDTTPPTVSVSAPSNGAVVAGNVTLSANAADNVAVDHVDFLVDGSVAGVASVGSPYSFNWNSRVVMNGSHTVRARAVDTSGNSTQSAVTTVTVANSSANLLQNGSLESASGSTPSCWLLGGYGTNTFAWTRTSDAHSGSFGEKLDLTALTNGDRKLVVVQDAGTCAPAGVPGKSYTVTVWYKSPALGPIVFGYYRNASGSWVYWSQSARFAASSSWAQASWTTPVLPAG
ncbi:MAG TPA: Ig-like domain-containing protein, partial [Candidatus Limnocylindrales bacterium]|nr:Ig-like domain-containing protein [Candidatus Limnocylindrales bacterium]